MNQERLAELFKAYLESETATQSQQALLDAETRTVYDVYHISKAGTEAEKKDYFLRHCKGIAKDLPALDWSILPVFECLDPKMICNEVLFYLASPQADERIATYLRGLIARISKSAAAKQTAFPSEDHAVQSLVLLRYLRQPEKRFPYFANLLHNLCSYLEYTPESYSYDYMGVRQFQELFETVSASLRNCFPEEFRRLTLERYRNNKHIAHREHYLAAHFLMTISTENLCGMMPVGSKYSQTAAYDSLLEKYINNVKETVLLLEPQLEFCDKELAFFCECLSPGSHVVQKRYGKGSIQKNDGTTMTVQFCDGKQRQLKLIPELVNDRIVVETNREEFEMRLFFARNTLRQEHYHRPMLAEAKARLAHLSSSTVTDDELLEIKLLRPNT